MDLYASINQRKSCRKYDMRPFSQEQMDEIENAIKEFPPLYAGHQLKYRFTKAVKGMYHVPAPHYLIISGNGESGEMENAGFLFESLVLWMDAKEIGSVWLGKSKDAEAANTDKDIIALAFGHATEPIHRAAGEFKRRPIEEICNAPDDRCIQAAHLAPSGMNTQPWYFEKQDGRVLVYKENLKLPVSLVYKLSDIDMGIGLCHYALACQEAGKPFHFHRDAALADKKGYTPFGVID